MNLSPKSGIEKPQMILKIILVNTSELFITLIRVVIPIIEKFSGGG